MMHEDEGKEERSEKSGKVFAVNDLCGIFFVHCMNSLN
jgi:hypothetical protein